MPKTKPDFKKRTAKLGKQAAKPANYTDTNVRFRRVSVAQQSVLRDKSGQFLSERMQTAETLAAQSRASSAVVRREATSQMAFMVRKYGSEFVQAKAREVVTVATNSIFAEEQDVRDEARALFQQAVERDAEAVVRHSALVTLKLKMTLKEGRTPIKRDILRLLQSPANVLVGVDIIIPVSECLQEPCLVDDACRCISEVSRRQLSLLDRAGPASAAESQGAFRQIGDRDERNKAEGWSTCLELGSPAPAAPSAFLSVDDLFSASTLVDQALRPGDVVCTLLDKICEYGLDEPLGPQAAANCFVLTHAMFSYIQAAPPTDLLRAGTRGRGPAFPGLERLARSFPLRSLTAKAEAEGAAAVPRLGQPSCMAAGAGEKFHGSDLQLRARLPGDGFVAACNMMLLCVFCWTDMLPELEIYLQAKSGQPGAGLRPRRYFDVDRLVGFLNDLRREKAMELAGDLPSSGEESSDESSEDSEDSRDSPAGDGAVSAESVADAADVASLRAVFSSARQLLSHLGTLLNSRGLREMREVGAIFLGCLVKYFSKQLEDPELTESGPTSPIQQGGILADLRGALRPLRPAEHLELLVDTCNHCQFSRSPALAALISQELCMHAGASPALSRALLERLQAELFRTIPALDPGAREALCARVGQALRLACDGSGGKGMGSLLPLCAEDPSARALLLASAEAAGLAREALALPDPMAFTA